MSRKKRKCRTTGRFATVTTCISTTLVLILLGTVVLFVTIGNNFSRQLREGLTVEVMLNDSISPAELQHVKAVLTKAPYARKVDYISKERGTREMNEALQGDACELTEGSPVPAEYEVYLKADYANLDSLHQYEKSMRALPGVSDLAYPSEVMEGLDRTIPTVGVSLLVVASLLALVSFSLINNSIRMSIYARRHSIRTMKLVGAGWGFIRRPFIFQALRIGIVAAMLAGGLLGGVIYYLQYVAGQGDAYINGLVTPEVWVATLGVIVVCAVALTVWSAYISVNKYLRMRVSDVYLK